MLPATWPGQGARLSGLSLIEIAADRPVIAFVFVASIAEPPFPPPSSETLAFIGRDDQLTDQFNPDDVETVKWVSQPSAAPAFRLAGDGLGGHHG